MIYPETDYNPNAKCPKCNFGHITTKHKPETYWPDMSLLSINMKPQKPVPFMSEYLERACPNCCYVWSEKIKEKK